MIGARFRALTAHSKQIRTEALVAAVGAIQRAHAEQVKKRLQQYPPPIPTSNYERTFKLQGGWKVEGPSLGRDGVLTRVVNRVGYAGFVHGDNTGDGQTEIHQGRWPLMVEELDRGRYIGELRNMMRGLRI